MGRAVAYSHALKRKQIKDKSLLGHSNVGKSCVLNSLVGKHVVKVGVP
jgi:GTP-binding protein EngB required for normal cell division